MGSNVRGSNRCGSVIFRTRPYLLWGVPSLLYNGYQFFPWGYSGRGVTLATHPSSAEVKEKVELYLYSPLRLFLTCSRVSFSFTFTFICRVKTFLYSPKHPNRIFFLPSLSFLSIVALFCMLKWLGREANYILQRRSRLRMHGT